MWRCCCCCCCCCLVVVTIEKPSQHRSTIQACPKKGKQDRAGIEPGTFRRKPVRDKTPMVPGAAKKATKSSLCKPAQSKRTPHFLRACAVETHFNIKHKHESAAHTTRNARGQKSTPHFVRACAVETHFDIKQEHEAAVHTTQNARGQKSTPHFVRACAVETLKQEHESAVHTTQNARGQKSTPHFVRACAVKPQFDIKQEHESAVNTTQNARGQSGHLNLAPRPFLLP